MATVSKLNAGPLALAELQVRVLTSFIKFDKVPTKFNEDFTKPYHGLIEILL